MNLENHTPIVLGHCNPFRIVVRRENEWNASLDDINNKTYDYVKLSRLSGYIDIGIAPLSLGIAFDGSLVLPALKEYSNKDNASQIFNETLGTLLLGGIYSEAVTPENISHGSLFHEGYSKIHGGGNGQIARFHSAIRQKLVGVLDVIRLLNPQEINISEIQEKYTRGKMYFSRLTNLSPTLLLNGTTYFAKLQWAESLVFLWTSIEQLINQIWNEKVVQVNIEATIKGRKDFLKDFRSWPTSTRIETLFQKGLIPIDTYTKLNSARKARNDFIHNGKQLSKSNVEMGLKSIFELISLLVTDYKSMDKLDEQFKSITDNLRYELQPRRILSTEEVSHWLEVPKLPGDANWGTDKYEIIQQLQLKPIKSDDS